MMLNDPGGDTIRVHVGRSLPLPDPSLYLHPPCFDTDGNPVFFGSANLNKTVQPCKVTLKDNELICSIPHRLVEHVHMGSFNILPFAENMELVPTSYGRIPPGYHPVVGGVDENGRPLYHAVTWVHQVRVPGRTSKQLGAAAVLFGGREHYVYHAHEILCWHDNNESNCDLPSGSHPVEHSSSGNQRHETPLKETSGILEPGEKDPAGMNIRVTVSDLSAVSHPAATDFDGVTPLYFGSAVMLESILPAKVIETRVCQALQDDIVVERSVGFSILPFDADMELVPASYGAIPRGRRPVQGNYDAQGRKLYHAMIYVLGRKIPGMCGEQLGGARGILQGTKYTSETGYDILCWKERAGPNPAHQSDSLRNCSIEDDPAGQRLRKPLDGPLTLAMTENLGEYMSNQLDASRWYFASALHNGSVIPCWVYTSSHTSCFLAYDGNVITHTGPYCVLPYFKDRMELVAAAGGKIPAGRTPVEGGRDKEGRPLYHAIGVVNDSNGRAKMIGMAAEHLGGAVIVCWGKIHKISTGYEVL